MHKVGDVLFDDFEVSRILQGGMGHVYICQKIGAGRGIAIKTFQPRYMLNEHFVSRFSDEAALWLALGAHHNIVQCLTVKTENSFPYIFLELIEGLPGIGASLRDWIERGPKSTAMSLSFVADICSGLTHAVSVFPKFVHSDLKPENVLIEEGPNALVTDFGLARLAIPHRIDDYQGKGEHHHTLSTLSSSIHGTPAYMAPEQWLGRAVDQRADIYAIGCILFELLTGRKVFQFSDLRELRDAHLNSFPKEMKEVKEQSVRLLIERCLKKNPGERYASYSELLAALEALSSTMPPINKKRIKYPKESPAGMSNRAAGLTILGKYAEAIELFDKAISIDNTMHFAHTDRARALMQVTRFEDALHASERAIELKPCEALPYLARSLALYRLGRIDDAIAACNQAVSISEDRRILGQGYYNLSVFQRSVGELKKAEEAVRKALTFVPEIADAYHQLAVVTADLEQFEEAFLAVNRALELNPRNSAALTLRGGLRELSHQFNAAKLDFEAAERAKPSMMALPNNSLPAAESPWKADLEVLQAIEEKRLSIAEVIEKSTLLGKMGQLKDALALLDQAIVSFPESSGLWLTRGRALSGLGQRKDALDCFQKAIDFDSSNEVAWYNKATILLRSGNFLEAIEHFDRAIQLNPINGQAICNRGTCFFQLGRSEKAHEDYKRSIDVSPLIPEPHYMLGVLKLQEGNTEAGKASLERAAKLGSSQAKAVLKQFLS